MRSTFLPFDLPLPPAPTSALPGSKEKVRVLAERARLGVSLWHPLDAGMPDDSPASRPRPPRPAEPPAEEIPDVVDDCEGADDLDQAFPAPVVVMRFRGRPYYFRDDAAISHTA